MKKEVKLAGHLIDPIRVNFNFHDFLQVIVGAFVLAVPIGFTQEVWDLGGTLPILNIIVIMFLTLFFITVFTYYHYHRNTMTKNPKQIHEMVKRVVATYIMSFVVVSVFLWSIDVTPWTTDAVLAFKRVVITTFPSAIGAAISDRI